MKKPQPQPLPIEELIENPVRGEDFESLPDKVAGPGTRACIRDGQIVISLPIEYLPAIVSVGCATQQIKGYVEVQDPLVFAKEIVTVLNQEGENGNTPVHNLFDDAINKALDDGALGVEFFEAVFGDPEDKT